MLLLVLESTGGEHTPDEITQRRYRRGWRQELRGWPESNGIGGRLESESVADFDRNRWPACRGIRRANVVFLGTVGLGKTHLATALGYTACLAGKSVLFATAVDTINTLAAAQAANRLKSELKKYLAPSLLILDELGYLPIDKHGADLLFQVISQRYERGATIITSNRAYKEWPTIFNNDSTLTAALLDRLLHHAETMVIEGLSYRMKDHIEE